MTPMRLAWLAGCLLVFLTSASVSARDAESIARWQEDLRYLESEAPRRHPNLFHHLTPEQWRSEIAELSARVPQSEDYELVAGVAKIVASLGPRDGHSRVNLLSPDLHFHTLPINFYSYSDGLFVRAVARQYADLAGARVVSIGSMTADAAWLAVSEYVAGDNAMSKRADTERVLSLSEILRAGGVATGAPDQPVRIVVEIGTKKKVVEVMPVVSLDGIDWVDVRSAKPAFYRRFASRDPFARHTADKYFWFEYLAEPKLLYVNFSVVSDEKDETVAAFFDRVFAFADSHDVRKLVLDIRLNGGGNNYLNRPILYGLVKRDKTIAQRGRFFTIIGRETFSAAQNLANLLDAHTQTIFVGEPTGGAPNHFGDSLRLTLPNSKLSINLVSVWWQDLDPRDQRLWIAPQLAAELSSADDRDGTDPALDAIVRYAPDESLSDIVRKAFGEGGKTKAAAVIASWKAEPQHKFSTGEEELVDVALEFYRANREADAVAVFELNAESNPSSWRAHHNLGRAYAAAKKNDAALAEFKRALEIRPNAPETLAAIDRL
jgi:tetratricopeptide (TPR) repeat protein